MATVIDEYTTEEQGSGVRFCEQKGSTQRIFIKKYFTLLWEVFVV
jgi:hypothetical protein